MFYKSIYFVFISAFVLVACNRHPGMDATDTPTAGSVSISIDESYTLLFQEQIYTFENLYDRAKVNVRYRTEKKALQDLMDDSSKVAVLNRELTPEETKAFQNQNIYPKTTKIAEDAIALIAHPNCPDSVVTLTFLKRLLAGEDSLWPAMKEKISIVFDHEESANARYMNALIQDKPFPRYCFAVKNNPQVIDYVSKNKNALGIISVNWVSDKDDTLSQGFLKKVKILAVGLNEKSESYKPYQAYIYTKEYPLTRSVYMINRQTRAGLGMGFVSFVAGEKGQRMIKLRGMIPASMPVRVIEVK